MRECGKKTNTVSKLNRVTQARLLLKENVASSYSRSIHKDKASNDIPTSKNLQFSNIGT